MDKTEIIRIVCSSSDFAGFRLIGSAALVLYTNHRKAKDIDFASDQPLQHEEITLAINRLLPTAQLLLKTPYTSTWLYCGISFDFLYTAPFINGPVDIDGIRVASIEDIASGKFRTFKTRQRESDRIDIAALQRLFTLDQMEGFCREREEKFLSIPVHSTYGGLL